MTVYRCDRCGAIQEEMPFGVKAGRKEHWSVAKEDDFIVMDLCPNCYLSLIDWAELKKE